MFSTGRLEKLSCFLRRCPKYIDILLSVVHILLPGVNIVLSVVDILLSVADIVVTSILLSVADIALPGVNILLSVAYIVLPVTNILLTVVHLWHPPALISALVIKKRKVPWLRLDKGSEIMQHLQCLLVSHGRVLKKVHSAGQSVFMVQYRVM